MTWWGWLLVGLFAGATIGLLTAAFCFAAAERDQVTR
jgi:hypothetical protein